MSDGMKTTIAALYDYGQWANERLLEKMRGWAMTSSPGNSRRAPSPSCRRSCISTGPTAGGSPAGAGCPRPRCAPADFPAWKR